MLNKNIIIKYIYSLTNESARAFAARFNIEFSKEEINILLPYLKQNCERLYDRNDKIKRIQTELSSNLSLNSINKFCNLLTKLGI